jgi:cytochrome c oxidase assembly protein subunit 15
MLHCLRTDFIKLVTVRDVSVLASLPVRLRTANFTRYAWGVLGWNLMVILWGAYVRASGSGAGCGSHWPLCNGEVVPRAPRIETIIEFTHRLTSGGALLAVIGLFVWSVVLFPRSHRVRRSALASVVLFITEAALGAGLVLFDYVGLNTSVWRAFYLSLHLLNTEFLLAALILTVWFAQNPGREYGCSRTPLVIATLPAALIVMMTGAIAALGDTLFPASSLAAGIRQDLSAASNFLVRLRVLHPALAVLAAIVFIAAAFQYLRSSARPLALKVLALTMAQVVAGAINIALLAPSWMQIIHLLMADLVWLALVLLALEGRSPVGSSQTFAIDRGYIRYLR